ncbi:MAG TPA: thioredoxin-like domain-containing protein [Blastocatellia bacterium]|nr:thioredoxin-like domain-containing protein [Blastocatellia bacterium]
MTKLRISIIRLIALICLIGALAAAGPPQDSLRLADLSGRQVAPFAVTDPEVLVFIFVRSDCPISNRYAPEVKRLAQKFADKAKFRLIYPGADETSEAIRQHLSDYEYSLEALRDEQHALVKMTGAQVTPEAAVFVRGKKEWRLVYRGRIDDRYLAFGKMRPAPTVRDLEQTLESVSKGKTLKLRTTTAIGCFISP